MQNNPFSRLLTGAVQYSVAGILARAIAIFTLPLFLRLLTPEEYGIYAIALLTEQVLVIISGYAITNAVGKYYAETLNTGEGAERVVGTAMVGLLAIGVALSLLWQLLAPALSGIILTPSASNTLIIRLIGVSFLASLFFNLALAIWQLDQKIIAFATATITRSAALAAVGLAFIPLFAEGAVGAVLGITVASLVAGLGCVVWLVRRFRLSYDRHTMTLLLRHGLPLVPAALLLLALNGFDRYILKEISDFAAVGTYATAFTLATAVNLAFVIPFKQVWAPLMWRMRNQANEVLFHRRVLTYYITFQVFVVCGLVGFCTPLMQIVSGGRQEFVAIAFAIPLLYLGMALFGTYDVFSAGYFFESKTYYYTITVIVSTGVNIGANLILVPMIGLWGSVYASLLSYAVFAGLSFVFGRTFFAVPYDWKRITKVVVIGGCLCVLVITTQSLHWLAGFVMAGAAVLLFPLLLVWTACFDEGELRTVRNLVLQYAPWLARLFGLGRPSSV